MDRPPKPETDYTMRLQRSAAWAFPQPANHYVHTLVSDQQGAGARVVTLDHFPFTIGRVAPADLALADALVSRRHCRFSEAFGLVTVTDLGSTNGTYVDGERITARAALIDGMSVAVGPYSFRYQKRNRQETQAAQALDRDLAEAGRYVASILPAPLSDGPIRTEWVYEPCARLGGDAFGYQMLDDSHAAIYLLDVSGHGVGSALHAVSVANTLRQRLLPNVSFHDPAAVISGLNVAFPMAAHNELFFTIWYGVVDLATRVMRYAAAGHHAAFLIPGPAAAAIPLVTRNAAIGMTTGRTPVTSLVEVPAAASLCLFSDGVFEVIGRDLQPRTLPDLIPHLHIATKPGGVDALRRHILGVARPGPLDDDFCFLTARFP